MHVSRIGVLPLAIVSGLAAASLASAQPPARNLTELRLKVEAGDTIYITEEDRRERTGRVVDMTSETLTVSFDGVPRVLPESSIQRIRQRKPDSLWTGGLIGAAVGMGLGIAAASFSEECSHRPGSSGCIGPVLSMTGLGTAVGVGVDALIQGRAVIYETPRLRVRVSPLMAPGQVGVRLSMQFPSHAEKGR